MSWMISKKYDCWRLWTFGPTFPHVNLRIREPLLSSDIESPRKKTVLKRWSNGRSMDYLRLWCAVYSDYPTFRTRILYYVSLVLFLSPSDRSGCLACKLIAPQEENGIQLWVEDFSSCAKFPVASAKPFAEQSFQRLYRSDLLRFRNMFLLRMRAGRSVSKIAWNGQLCQ